MHLFFAILVIVAIGRFLTARDRVAPAQVTVNQEPAPEWITHAQENDIVQWIRSGGLKTKTNT